MGEQVDRALLHGKWVHAHEEDTPTERVFRPAGSALPRSRGRTGFELNSDQTAAHLGIGRGDETDRAAGTWELEEGDPPRLVIRLATGETQSLPVVSLANDRL